MNLSQFIIGVSASGKQRSHPGCVRGLEDRAGAVQKSHVGCAALLLLMIISATMIPLTASAASVSSSYGKSKRTMVIPKHAPSSLLPVVNQRDIHEKHRILADRVLQALPSFCRDHLKNFYVNYEKNPANRGLGGESTMIITGNVPDKEFMALVTHECGHVTDFGGLRGSDAMQPTPFADGTTPIYGDDPSMAFYSISWLSPRMMQPNMNDADFVSGYAETDPFEDFSESFAFYALQKKEFRRLANNNPILKAKYNFMDTVVFGGKEVASSHYKRGKNVAWDVTKLPYVWHAKR
ncbi:hypothetical protein EXS65_04375 [Candidatus Peribacteria bacterium]|nr:hypothetical protein [Candidatus Peribacteria bacterium]